uniref:Uncharacterized protein n=1 Tax=Anguilla anguilla TaxID=7936 RepID=A0A0E9Q8E8_ANGAN
MGNFDVITDMRPGHDCLHFFGRYLHFYFHFEMKNTGFIYPILD